MAVKVLKDLIGDWGGFEKLVAQLHETGGVSVEHNVQLVGKTGISRQIDVVIRQKQGYYEHLIIVECKYWNKAIERLHVDAFASAVDDLNASKGVIFSTRGFQEGALTAAKHYGIDLFKVRELTDAEWGMPGRVIDFFMQLIQPSLGNYEFKDLSIEGNPSPLTIRFGRLSNNTVTPLETAHGVTTTLEATLDILIKKGMRQIYRDSSLFFNGANGTRYMRKNVEFTLNSPLRISSSGGTIVTSKVSFDLGIKIVQFRMKIDRGEYFNFMLGVEDCIRGGVVSVYQENAVQLTKMTGVHVSEKDAKNAFINGSIMKIMRKEFFPFSEVEGLIPGEYRDVDGDNSSITLLS